MHFAAAGVGLEGRFQHRNGFGGVLARHQRIADGGQQVIGDFVTFGEQGTVFGAQLFVAAQAVEQDQPVVADPQRRGLRGQAVALQIALHLRQRVFGLIQAGVFARAIGQAPADPLGQVVGFEALLLRIVEQVGAGLVQLPRAVRIADVGQGEHLQAVQQVVVGRVHPGALDRGKRVEPTGLVTVSADLCQMVSPRRRRKGGRNRQKKSGACQADAKRQRPMLIHGTPGSIPSSESTCA
jgi:hypothetical protein